MNSLLTSGSVISGTYYPNFFRLGNSRISLDAIPPERMGLHGEYDHNGLAGRVRYQCSQVFGLDAISQLKIRQRGSVVVLYGCVPSKALLERILRLAIQAEGATSVELRGVEIGSNR